MSVRRVLCVAGTVLLLAGPAQAGTITVASVLTCSGQPTCTVGTDTVTATGGNISSQTLNGYTGVGINSGSGDAVAGEISGSEYLTYNFGSAGIVDSIGLVFLYEPPAFGDQEFPPGSDETAAIQGFNGNTLIWTVLVNVTGINSATTSAGSVSNVSVANETGGGAWLLSNPFGAFAITSLKFYSPDPGPTGAYSDFAVGDVVYRAGEGDPAPVPEPASLLLLGSGLSALAVRARRRRS